KLSSRRETLGICSGTGVLEPHRLPVPDLRERREAHRVRDAAGRLARRSDRGDDSLQQPAGPGRLLTDPPTAGRFPPRPPPPPPPPTPAPPNGGLDEKCRQRSAADRDLGLGDDAHPARDGEARRLPGRRARATQTQAGAEAELPRVDRTDRGGPPRGGPRR